VLGPDASSTIDDADFDALYPVALRVPSRRFWTPVAVARLAARMFEGAGCARVLDVGSGAGKLVLVAACSAPDIDFEGVEHRPRLVAAARSLGRRLRIANARFRVGDATDVAWGDFDGVYLFNPFAENLWAREARLDQRIELGEARHARDVLRVERALREASPGTAVVTYNGAGAAIPASYDLAREEHTGTEGALRLWIQTTRPDGGSFFLERGESVERRGPEGRRGLE